MRKQHILRFALPLAAGLVAGAVIGYALMAFGVLNRNPMFSTPRLGGNTITFDEAFRSLARLSTLELYARNCDGKTDVNWYLSEEDKILDGVLSSSPPAGLTPGLHLQRAIVSARRAMAAEKKGERGVAASAIAREQQELREAGWKDPSHDRLVRVLALIDECGAAGMNK